MPNEWDYDPQNPNRNPLPRTGCKTCAQLVQSIEAAQKARDDTRATDHRVLMRRHLDAHAAASAR